METRSMRDYKQLNGLALAYVGMRSMKSIFAII